MSVSETKNANIIPVTETGIRSLEPQPQSINTEVAYATLEKQIIRCVNVDQGTTLGAAIVQSGIMMDFPDLELENAKVGIFGKVASMVTILNAGDRVEIYRPLIADPKEMRRKCAAEGKVMKKGSGSTNS